jgi:hypothetical protein
VSADEKSPELAKKNESPANKTTLAEPVVKEDPSQFPAGTVPTMEVPVSNGALAEELKKLEELHNKKGGGQKEEKKEEEKKDAKKEEKKTLATVEPKNATKVEVKIHEEPKNATKVEVKI